MVVSSRKVNGLSPVTNERNIETEIRTQSNANRDSKFQAFPYDCGSRLCNHEHICLNGYKPDKLLEQEKETLTNEWKREFGISKDEYRRHTNSWKEWMTFDEYIIAHAKLLVYDFHTSISSK
jgi:hypothetical protein